jgi:hypothetical protein
MIRYFGTDLKQAGHYFWMLENDNMWRHYMDFKEIDFDPYDGQKPKPKGTTTFFQTDKFTVIVINGSCSDNRNGTVSTFFTQDRLMMNELKEKILSIPIAVKIIEQMPFNIKW